MDNSNHSDRKFNFEFDPNKVYIPTHVLRVDDYRENGYDNVKCPDTPERAAALAATKKRIQKELDVCTD